MSAMMSRALVLVLGAGLAQASTPATETVYYDAVENGQLVGGRLELPRPDLRNLPTIHAPVTALMLGGEWITPGTPTGDSIIPNRLNLVVVGDGYQTAQLPAYATHTQNAVTQLFNVEPFRTYRPLFNVFRVDVTSVDSGVDNDPVQGIARNTALDMAFWCAGIERLLCVDVVKARQFAQSIGGPPHQIFAVANSTKYGGAGYTSSDLGTFAGANSAAAEIAIHELGHSLGDLADEYDYGGPPTYTGPERPERNISILSSVQMTAQQSKWFRWLGNADPAFDGPVDSFVGAYYSVSGINRPTFNSKMRSLGRPFNLPSAEAIISQIYTVVRPIETASPPPNTTTFTPIFSVSTVQPENNPLAIQWFVDNVPVPGATGPTFDARTAPSSALSLRAVRVRVVDNTPMVADPTIRTLNLTQTMQWTWSTCYANCDLSTTQPALNALDFVCYLSRFADGQALPAGEQAAAYANCDGSTTNPVLNALDFACFLTLYRAGCP